MELLFGFHVSRALALRGLWLDFGGGPRGLFLDELLGDVNDVTTLSWLLVGEDFSLLLDLHF